MNIQCNFSVFSWISIFHARSDSYHLRVIGPENTHTVLQSQFWRYSDWEYWELWLQLSFLKLPELPRLSGCYSIQQTIHAWSFEAWHIYSKDSLQWRYLEFNDFTFPWETVSVGILWVSLRLTDLNQKSVVQVPMISFSWEQAFLKLWRIGLVQHVCSQLRTFPFNERNTWCSCCHGNKTLFTWELR